MEQIPVKLTSFQNLATEKEAKVSQDGPAGLVHGRDPDAGDGRILQHLGFGKNGKSASKLFLLRGSSSQVGREYTHEAMTFTHSRAHTHTHTPVGLHPPLPPSHGPQEASLGPADSHGSLSRV